MPDSRITPQIVADHGLSPEEYQRVLHAMGREPNLTELGIFSVMWSEHCSYKSSRVHLKTLPTTAPWVICGPGENAGVIVRLTREGKTAVDDAFTALIEAEKALLAELPGPEQKELATLLRRLLAPFGA